MTTTRCAWPTTPSTGSAAAWSGCLRPGPSTSAARSGPGLVTVQAVDAEAVPDLGPGGGQGPGWGAHPKGIGQTGAFGGYKQSGLGREWGRQGLEDFTEVKNLVWS